VIPPSSHQHRKLVSPSVRAPQAGAAIPDASSVNSWLELLTSLLELPEDERRAVRDELESHLRDRVHDLTLSGLNEAQASSRAISELGDAALLARRFKEAIEPSKRRLIMNVAAISIASAAILFSGIAVFSTRATPAPCPPGETPSEEARMSATNELLRTRLAALYVAEGQPLADPQIASLLSAVETQGVSSPSLRAHLAALTQSALSHPPVRTSSYEQPVDEVTERLKAIRLTMSGQSNWQTFFDTVGKSIGMRAVPQWDRLAPAGIERNGEIHPATDATAAAILADENSQVNDPVAARIEGDRIIFAPQSVFDRREQTLAVYDLAGLIELRLMMDNKKPEQIVDEVKQLITSLVEADQWRENGGDRASIHQFDSKLFIQAPKRFHEKIEWIVQQVFDGKAIGASRVPASNAPAAAAALPGTAQEEPPVIYIDGAVGRPGVYAVSPGGTFTLARALTAAGGTKDTGGEVVITRLRNGKQEVMQQLKTADVMAGNAADPVLSAGDRVVVNALVGARVPN
jgi:hypothetical protein